MLATSRCSYSRREGCHPFFEVEAAAWKAEQVRNMLQRNQLAPRSVCEVSCGAPGILHSLQRKLAPGCQFVGYEISPQAHFRCAQHVNERLRFVLGDFLQEPRRECDVLVCVDVVEHVEDYLGFLRKIRSKAKHKLFHVPLDLSVRAIYGGVPEAMRKSSGCVHYFTRRIFLEALRETGYRVTDWSYTLRAAETRPRSIAAACAGWPRNILYTFSPELASRTLGGYSLLVLAE